MNKLEDRKNKENKVSCCCCRKSPGCSMCKKGKHRPCDCDLEEEEEEH